MQVEPGAFAQVAPEAGFPVPVRPALCWLATGAAVEASAAAVTKLTGFPLGLVAWLLGGAAAARTRLGGAGPGGEPGAGGGQVLLGPLGPLAQLGAGFLQDLGAGVEGLAQFVPLAGGVGAGLGGRVACLGGAPVSGGQALGELLAVPVGGGAQLVELAGGGLADLVQLGGCVLAGPGGLGAGVLGAGLGRGRALLCLPGLLEGLVPGGAGGGDGGFGLGAGRLGLLPGGGLGVGGALGRGGDGGLGFRADPADGRVPLVAGGLDLSLGASADPVEFGGVGGQRGGQLVGRLTGAGLGVGPGGVDRLGCGVGLLAHPDRGLGAALGLGPGRFRRGGALLGRGAGRLDLVLGGAGVGHRCRGAGQPLPQPGQPVGQGAHLAEHLGPADPGHGDRLVGVRHGRGVLAAVSAVSRRRSRHAVAALCPGSAQNPGGRPGPSPDGSGGFSHPGYLQVTVSADSVVIAPPGLVRVLGTTLPQLINYVKLRCN